MINGAHSIIFSADADADRAFLRDVLGLPHVDVGDGWLIFGLPPAEVAVHPSGKNDAHQLYLMTHDVEALIETLSLRDIDCSPVQDQGWGLVTEVTLPGGGKLPVYQPRHARPSINTKFASARKGRGASTKKKGIHMAAKKKKASKKAAKAPKKAAKKAAKKAGKKKAAKKKA